MGEQDRFEIEVKYKTPDGIKLSGMLGETEQSSAHGNIIMAHGLNNHKDENGFGQKGNFIKLAHKLLNFGFNTFRFDFRGHGDSEGETKDVTIEGELLDFKTSLEFFESKCGISPVLVIIASSFGASSSILYTSERQDKVKTLVLWNPVLDYKKTFLEAETPWGRTFFNDEGYKKLEQKKYVEIPETNFKIGKKMVEEFRKIELYNYLNQLIIPVLTIHGTHDTCVPYTVSKEYGTPNQSSKFISYDTDHTFPDYEDNVLDDTFQWIKLQTGLNTL